MSNDENDSKIETHQDLDDSDVFTKDKRVNIDIKSI